MMKFHVFLIILFLTSFYYVQESTAENCEPVQLEYNIEDGSVVETCYDKKTVTLFMKIDAQKDDTQITVHLPKTLVFSLDQECNSAGDIIFLLNYDEMTPSTLTETSSERIATLVLPKGENAVEIIGTFTLGMPSPLATCGSVHGYDTQYVPPKLQLKLGVSPQDVICNDGLELTFKYADNSPVCVKPTSVTKLVTWGWAQPTKSSDQLVLNNLRQLYVLTDNELLRSEGNNLISLKKLDRTFSELSEYSNFLYLTVENSENTESNVLVLDEEFEEYYSYNFGRFYDLAIEGGIVHLLDDEGLSFKDLNPDVNIDYSSVSLEKPGHDILIKGNHAYVVDDIVMPIYLHIIDISDHFFPVKYTKEYEYVNTHLETQDIANNKWYVLAKTIVMNGHWEYLDVYGTAPQDLQTEPEHYELLGFDYEGGDNLTDDEWSISSIKVEGDLVYALGNGKSGSVFAIFSLDQDVTQLGRLDLDDSSSPSNVVLSDKRAYVGGQKGVYVIDVSNALQPQILDVIETETPVQNLLLASIINVEYDENLVGVNGYISNPVKKIHERTCFTLSNDDLPKLSNDFKLALASVSKIEEETDEPEYTSRAGFRGFGFSLDYETALNLIQEHNFTEDKVHIDSDIDLPLEYHYDCFFEYDERQYFLEFYSDYSLISDDKIRPK